MNAKTSTSDNDAMAQRAFAFYQSGKLAEAKTLFEGLLAQFPRHHQLLTVLGTISLQLGTAKEAVRLFDASLEVMSSQADALVNRGIALQALDRLPEAMTSYERA